MIPAGAVLDGHAAAVLIILFTIAGTLAGFLSIER